MSNEIEKSAVNKFRAQMREIVQEIIDELDKEFFEFAILRESFSRMGSLLVIHESEDCVRNDREWMRKHAPGQLDSNLRWNHAGGYHTIPDPDCPLCIDKVARAPK